jgi:hypothetical protein
MTQNFWLSNLKSTWKFLIEVNIYLNVPKQKLNVQTKLQVPYTWIGFSWRIS